MQSEHGLKVYLNDYRNAFCIRYRQQDFTIIFCALRTRGGVQLMHYLRPVPGHTGRVIRDTTSAPDQAACTVSGTIFPQLALFFLNCHWLFLNCRWRSVPVLVSPVPLEQRTWANYGEIDEIALKPLPRRGRSAFQRRKDSTL